MSFSFRSCSIDGCDGPVVARQLCRKHYQRWWSTGDPEHLTKRPYGGGGPNDSGYWRIQVGGVSVREHVHIAEKVIGRKLPPGAVVHHVDHKRANNAHHNLVVCPSHAYHMLLHKRERALDACGNASYEHCSVCKRYDDPANMRSDRTTFYHAACRKSADATRYKKAKEGRRVVPL